MSVSIPSSVRSDRPDLPFLQVDVDAIYFHTTAAVRLGGELYAVGGLRRIALKYDICLASWIAFLSAYRP